MLTKKLLLKSVSSLCFADIFIDLLPNCKNSYAVQPKKQKVHFFEKFK
jgi:hypothetical protein